VLIVDTTVWLDAADRDARHHGACAQLLLDRADQLVTPAVVVGEAARLIRFKLGAMAEVQFVHLMTSGTVEIVDLTSDDWLRVAELVEGYSDTPLGVVDAAIVAVAERLSAVEIATMNGRDFYVVRPKHAEAFTLLPEGVARVKGGAAS
jgi:uncharacterized protein